MVERRIYRGNRKGGRISKATPAPRVRPERAGPLHAELVVVGREILRGYVADTNSRAIVTDLTQRGAVVHRVTVVDDQDRAIARAVTEAIERGVGLIVTIGGLGPTSDDCTLAGVADALGVPLATHPQAVEMVENAFRRLRERGQVSSAGMTRTREKLCAIPVGAEAIENREGVPPGVLTRLTAGATVACLPGTPRECLAVWSEVAGRIRDLQVEVHRAQRELEAPTADESVLQPWIATVRDEYPTVWIKTFAPGWNRGRRGKGTRVVFEATARTRHEAEVAAEGAMQRLLAIAGSGK